MRLQEQYPYYLAGTAVQANADLVVTTKYTGDLATRAALADAATIDRAIAAATESFDKMRRLPAYRRQSIIEQIIGRIRERQDELAHVVCAEAGKPIRDARAEVARMIDTFRVASGESLQIKGEYLSLDIGERSAHVEGICRKFPIGPCGFITPFNFPLNLAAHKIAPALAVGCPFILKPASATPISALLLGEILAETDLPPGAFSILPCRHDAAEALITDDRIRLISFTGSPDVGWDIKARAGRKKVALELGGNAAVIVDEGVDLERAADRIVFGAFYQSGQSCISVQRIIAHESIYEPLKNLLHTRATGLKAGDPMEEDTFLGPLISMEDAERIERWVKEAVESGAAVVCGGRRHGSFYEPTLLENVGSHLKINCQEVFGPAATLQPFREFADAVRQANDSRFGLQAGVFTNQLRHAHFAFEQLEVGGVIINDVPSFRVESMPYGGVKESGFGREGVRYSMDEMTEMRLMVLNRPAEL